MSHEPSAVEAAGPMQRPSAGSTLLYALGDLVHPSPDAVPTSALLTVLGQAGYEKHAARQAIARAGNAGWIVGARRGRETWWAITDDGHRLIEDGLQRVADLGRDALDWDGRWVVVVATVPHAQRAKRQRLYRYLTWSGFGSPVPGVWIAPFADRAHGAEFAINTFELSETTLSFIGTPATFGLTESAIVDRAWALDDLEAHYQRLVALYRRCDPQAGEEAIKCVLRLDGDLQDLPLLDPQLPAALAPASTSRDAARQLLAYRAAWLGPARAHWESVVAAAAQPLPPR